MKIAVPATGRDLDAPADSRFGRCSFFLVVDSDSLDHEVVENTVAQEASGAGVAAVALVADAGAQIVIAGRLGPNAMDALLARGLALYQGLDGSVRDQIEAYTGGRLQPLSTPTTGGKSGLSGSGGDMDGGGRGRGGGGRGMGGGGRGRGGGGRGMGGGGRGRGGGGRGRGGQGG